MNEHVGQAARCCSRPLEPALPLPRATLVCPMPSTILWHECQESARWAFGMQAPKFSRRQLGTPDIVPAGILGFLLDLMHLDARLCLDLGDALRLPFSFFCAVALAFFFGLYQSSTCDAGIEVASPTFWALLSSALSARFPLESRTGWPWLWRACGGRCPMRRLS